MSDMWLGAGDALRVTPRTVAALTSFTPWASRIDTGGPMAMADEFEADEPATAQAAGAVIDPEAIALDGFAKGFEEGRRTLQAQLAEERVALARLAATLEAVQPQPPAALAALIGETVGFLVRQIMGEVEVDPALLRARAEAAAALVSDEARPARMRLHPADADRLAEATIAVPLVADPSLSPGSVVIETRDGWIEDGPEVAFERLRAQLGALAVPR